MKETTRTHRNTILEAMLALGAHPTKRRNLNLIHQVCEERHKLGSRDFTLRSIGEFVEARGGLKVKALWNRTSEHYRKLIEAWEAFAGDPPTSRRGRSLIRQTR